MAKSDIDIEIRMGAPVMLPNRGKGADLAALLRKELGIPHRVKWFEVRFAADEIVTVTCEYMPEDDSLGHG
jgi:hypothetical protein